MASERRQQILKAALDVFMRYGYRRATMDDVAREVGKSRPALYLSFPSKEALLIGVVEMGFDQTFRAIEAGFPGQDTLSARLRYVFELWSVRPFELVARSPAASELMNGDYAFAKEAFARGAKRLAAILSELIRAAVADPGALQPSAEARARIMIAAAHGYKTVARDAEELRAFIHDLVRMTVAGLPVDQEATRAPRQPRRRVARRASR
jgi:AcrR family transcriptional regulator